MSKNPNQPQTNDAVLGRKSSSTSLSECPVCKTECDQGKVNRCCVCNWDLTPCPEAFVEKHNAQLAWAREMWINLQAQEKQLHASQSQLEEVKQDKARFEGEVLHRLEQLEQVQDKSEPVIWAQMPQDTSKLDELEKQLSRIREQLKGAERERQELKSEIAQLSAQVAKFDTDPQKKIANDPSLISEVGIDYSRLRDFLARGEWKKANEETKIIIGTLVWLVTGDCNSIYTQCIQQIPAPDIQTIDNLWLHYSYGRFGFSIQKRIYKELDENLLELGKSVGWINSEVDNIDLWRYHSEELGSLKYKKNIFENLSFELDGYIGHLPMLDVLFYDPYKWVEYVEEYIDLKESNIIYIFAKLPESGIEQD